MMDHAAGALRATPDACAQAIFGCAGPHLSADEAAFFRETRPWGFILFARNVQTPDQLRALTDALRESVGWRAPILIDQEGGRVARLRRPMWRDWQSVGLWTKMADDGRVDEGALLEGLRLRYRLIASELRDLGVDVNCAPLLDLRFPDTHDIIGDRALGVDVARVVARARAIHLGLAEGGVAPVIKHMPGHGRATVDSHHDLPRVETPRATLSATDFAAFRDYVSGGSAGMGMTAHVVFSDLDAERCATLSPTVISDVVRDEIGFDGLLMTDDLSMGALTGDHGDRARQSLAAGCDIILHCNGDRAEMAAVVAAIDALDGAARRRADRALIDPAQTVAARANPASDASFGDGVALPSRRPADRFLIGETGTGTGTETGIGGEAWDTGAGVEMVESRLRSIFGAEALS